MIDMGMIDRLMLHPKELAHKLRTVTVRDELLLLQAEALSRVLSGNHFPGERIFDSANLLFGNKNNPTMQMVARGCAMSLFGLLELCGLYPVSVGTGTKGKIVSREIVLDDSAHEMVVANRYIAAIKSMVAEIINLREGLTPIFYDMEAPDLTDYYLCRIDGVSLLVVHSPQGCYKISCRV